jgi:chemotaxis protein MotB
MTFSEEALFKNPYSVLANIAQEVGQQANVSTKGEGGASDSGPSTGADGGEAYRDPFDPDFWSKQPETPAQAKLAADTSLPGEQASAFSRPPAIETVPVPVPAPAKPETTPKPDTADASANKAKAEADATEKDKAEELQKEIQAQVAGIAGKLAEGIVVQPAEGGTLITISDEANTAMFNVGSALPGKDLVLAMEKIGKLLADRQGSVIIRGHTDGRPFKGRSGDNWSLSMSRAHAAYYMLVRGGLNEERVKQVSGFADRRLQKADDPLSGANRRIEILLGNG